MNLEQFAVDPLSYYAYLASPSRLDPWQVEDFRALAPGWQRVMGRQISGGYSRGWLERGKAGSKTTDAARMISYSMLFTTNRIEGIVAAADFEQTSMIRKVLERDKAEHPVLMKPLEIGRREAVTRHNGGLLTFITSDARSAHGWDVEFIVADEVTHWQSRDLMDSIASSADKPRNRMLLLTMNAGFLDSWQGELRAAIQSDPAWHFSSQTKRPSWVSEQALMQQQKLLRPSAYDRLWGNRWVAGSGDALPVSEITAAVTETRPMIGNEPGWQWFAGLDLAVRHDHSALCVVGIRDNRIRLADIRGWAPPRNGKISLARVREAVLEVHARFGLSRLLYDPTQGELLAEDVSNAGVKTEQVSFGSEPARVAMATVLIERFHARTIDLYPDDGLMSDLRCLRFIDKGTSFKLDPGQTKAGHGDKGVSFVLALLGAERYGARAFGEMPRSSLNYDDERGRRSGSFIDRNIPRDAWNTGSGDDDLHKGSDWMNTVF